MKRPRVGRPLKAISGEDLTSENIRKQVAVLAKKIHAEYSGSELTIVSVLSGAVRFTADLISHLPKIALRLKFVEVQSYHGGETSGELHFGSISERDITGKDVLIVDDILDSGKTIYRLIGLLKAMEAKSVATCVMLRKEIPRKYEIVPDFVGFEIENEFVVGYGLDYQGLYRNLSCVTVMVDEQ